MEVVMETGNLSKEAPKAKSLATVAPEIGIEKGAICADEDSSVSTPNERASENGADEEPDPLVEDGMQCEPKRLYEGGETFAGSIEWVEEIPDKFKNRDDGDVEARRAKFAILLRTQLINNKPKLHSIVVQSPLIKAALKPILAEYPGLFLAKEPLVFEAPFKPFVHRWTKFTDVCENGEEGSEELRHLKLLREALEPELKESFTTIKDFAKHGAIEFPHLWMVFPPGCYVFTVQDKVESAFKLIKTENHVSKKDNKKYFLMHCYYIDWDGKKFGRALQVLAIPQFEGSAGQKELPAYPFEYLPTKSMITPMLIERGRKFETYADVLYRAYEGVAVDNTSHQPELRHVKGRIVIDVKTYMRFNPYLDTPLGPLRQATEMEEPPSDADNDLYVPNNYYSMFRNQAQLQEEAMNGAETVPAGNEKVNLNDDELIICRHQVRGYSLKLKKWLDFDVNLIKEIKWNTAAFDSLALPGDYKYLLLAFARSQGKAAAQFDDVIEGKGKGMVMLLEGPPGVGKTLTVESVAEEMRVPLYSISAGQLRTDPAFVQEKLEQAFEIATAWKAVILLDEADIFLEQRSIHNLLRNQLVSVFLQSLEYYEGTIFLTTNRVDCIDQAFESRIHISLPYPELNVESRHKVWTNFLKTLQIDTSAISNDQINKFAAIDLNGRQIKNTVKMAGLLAATENGGLKPEHVETVIKIARANKKQGGSRKPDGVPVIEQEEPVPIIF